MFMVMKTRLPLLVILHTHKLTVGAVVSCKESCHMISLLMCSEYAIYVLFIRAFSSSFDSPEKRAIDISDLHKKIPNFLRIQSLIF